MLISWIQILGIINDFDTKIIRSYEDNKKTFLYIKNNRINGALAENNGRDISIIRKLLKKNIVPNLEKLQNININLKELLWVIFKTGLKLFLQVILIMKMLNDFNCHLAVNNNCDILNEVLKVKGKTR